MQLSRSKFRKSFILSTQKWIKCFPGKNLVNSRGKSGDITCQSHSGFDLSSPAFYKWYRLGIPQRRVNDYLTRSSMNQRDTVHTLSRLQYEKRVRKERFGKRLFWGRIEVLRSVRHRFQSRPLPRSYATAHISAVWGSVPYEHWFRNLFWTALRFLPEISQDLSPCCNESRSPVH